ncbi:hypothetical protein [Paenibacillus sp. FSL L8-0709]|uniref:hypothetical protein n=1 Tax=Paenibacillus sp. FSL L8-0709 TaxID=2975312 RepID=UPI0030F80195
MKDKVKGLVFGLILGSLFTSSAIFADFGTKEMVWNKTINFFMNGEKKTTDDVVIVNGTSYIPLKTASKVFNVQLTADFDRNNIYLGRIPTNKGITALQAIEKVKSVYGNKIPKNYHVSMEEIDEDGNYLVHVYEIVIDNKVTGDGHTATFGWYIVDKFTGDIIPNTDF